jgi:transcriptional regulator with XRE-family HTH domain
MPNTKVDIEALYAAVRRKRQTASTSWRDIASDLSMSPSTFTRLAQGRRPDVDTFVTLVAWLGVPAEAFMRPHPANDRQSDPVALVSSYLRSSPGIRAEDADTITDIVEAVYHRLAGTRQSRSPA